MHKKRQENWNYYTGDTFDYWAGPLPPRNHEAYSEYIEELRKSFATHNVIEEAVTHYVNSLVGQPINFFLSLNKQELSQQEKDRLSADEELLQQWWDWQKTLALEQGQSKPLAQAITQMLVTSDSEDTGLGCGFLRLYTPAKFAEEQSYKRIALHCPSVESVTIKRDDDGFIENCTYWYANGFEEYRLLANGLTEIFISTESLVVDYGGVLPLFQLRGKSLLGRAAKQLQNSINKTLTLKNRAIDAGYFRERVIVNAMPPGEFIQDSNSPSGERFERNESGIRMGPNRITYLQGIPVGDRLNPTGYTNPSVIYKDPMDISMFEKSLAIDYQAFWLAMGLGHLLTTGDGSLSGRSRETIKNDFLIRLEGYAEIVEIVLQSVFTLALKIMAQIYNRPDMALYTPVVELNLAIGKPLAEERQQTIAEYNAGLKSRTRAMTDIGISDPDSEMQLILREREDEAKQLAGQQKISMDFLSN